MKRKFVFAFIFLTLVSHTIIVSETLAHAPLGPGDNESLETATEIIDPTKSWAIYAKLHEGGEAQYYRFNATAGQRIHIMLYKSTRPEDTDFLPGFVLMGPQKGQRSSESVLASPGADVCGWLGTCYIRLFLG